MRDCGRIYFATHTHSSSPWHVSSKTSGILPFRTVTSNESCIPSWIAFLMPQGEMFSPATVHVERKLYRQLLRKLPRRAMGAFLFLFFFYFFPPRSARCLTRFDSGEADEGVGLETRVHRAIREFQYRSTESLVKLLKQPDRSSAWNCTLMHLKTNNVHVWC